MELLTRPGDLQVIYNSYLAIACNVPNAFFVILTALLGHKFNTKLQVWLSPTQLFYTFIQFLLSLDNAKRIWTVKRRSQDVEHLHQCLSLAYDRPLVDT